MCRLYGSMFEEAFGGNLSNRFDCAMTSTDGTSELNVQTFVRLKDIRGYYLITAFRLLRSVGCKHV